VKKHRVHLICNAHLDPVWQWRWEEGCAEAMATFQTAADLLDEHPDLIFNHNEALLYRWVEKYDPRLFLRIRELVKQERWHISGGWFLQPDANLPGVESYFRHIREGRLYFLDRFGVTPRVAYNFDSFGHCWGLPQVLRLCGYDMYIHMRPGRDGLDLPSELYQWEGADGTRIPALRIEVGLYHTERDNIEDRLRQGVEAALKQGRDVPVFWGLGNHGGGPTREDLKKIDEFMGNEKRVSIIHSTPESLCEALAVHARVAPIKKGDLQRAFTGCYTSLSRLKRRARKSLGRLKQAEAMAAAAWWAEGADYPDESIEQAWRDHLFNDFHDILPGTCIQPAEQDSLDIYGKAAECARNLRLGAIASLTRGPGRQGSALPVTVMNTSPSTRLVPVEVEFMADYRPYWKGDWRMSLRTPSGKKPLFQEEKPESLLPFNDWRRKVCFMADLPGLGIAHYLLEAHEKKAEASMPGQAAGRADAAPLDEDTPVCCSTDPSTGLITGMRTSTGKECVSGPLLQPVVVLDHGDSWGTGLDRYNEEAGRFEAMKGSVKTVQRGPVRSIIESVHTYGSSRIVMHTITYTMWPVVELRFRVLWNEASKRLKLGIPTVFSDGTLDCEIPGGVITRPADGREHVHGRWMIIGEKNGTAALGIVNSGQHGIDFQQGRAHLSVLRGPAYCHEQGLDLTDREVKHMDQGVHQFRLLAVAGEAGELAVKLPGLADWLDAPPIAIAHLPAGKLFDPPQPKGSSVRQARLFPGELLSLSPGNVRMTAFKRSQDKKGLTIRLQESAGKKCNARILLRKKGQEEGADYPKDIKDRYDRINSDSVIDAQMIFNPFEIKTLRLNRSGSWHETDPVLEL